MVNLDNSFPVIETERLLLRQVRKEDRESLFSIFSNERVTIYYDLDTYTTVEQADFLINRIQERHFLGTQLRWAITIKESGSLIGTCGFHEIEEEHSKAETGYELNPNYWRRGIMSEALNAILLYGFTKKKWNRIEALFDIRNVASKKVLEKCGFQMEGIMRERFKKNGISIDTGIAAILKKEFIDSK
jgi:ribosomal-protein-alanine N-acetyltransferase